MVLLVSISAHSISAVPSAKMVVENEGGTADEAEILSCTEHHREQAEEEGRDKRQERQQAASFRC